MQARKGRKEVALIGIGIGIGIVFEKFTADTDRATELDNRPVRKLSRACRLR